MLAGDASARLSKAAENLASAEPWTAETLESTLRAAAEAEGFGLGKVAQPLRAALTGSNASPGIFEVMEVLGKSETIARIRAVPGVAADI